MKYKCYVCGKEVTPAQIKAGKAYIDAAGIGAHIKCMKEMGG